MCDNLHLLFKILSSINYHLNVPEYNFRPFRWQCYPSWEALTYSSVALLNKRKIGECSNNFPGLNKISLKFYFFSHFPCVFHDWKLVVSFPGFPGRLGTLQNQHGPWNGMECLCVFTNGTLRIPLHVPCRLCYTTSLRPGLRPPSAPNHGTYILSTSLASAK